MAFLFNISVLQMILLTCIKQIVIAGNTQYRKDYIYLSETDSFYKIHKEVANWNDAKEICAGEGSTLFYPDDKKEANAFRALWNTTSPSRYMLVGIRAMSKTVFETVDGKDLKYNEWSSNQPDGNVNAGTNCVQMMDDGQLFDYDCLNKDHFSCKKRMVDIEWNFCCNIYDRAYIFNGDLDGCYKLHLTPSNWTEANRVCEDENSYLAVINSEDEARFLSELVDRAPIVPGYYVRGAVALGFHNRDQLGWRTVKGTALAHSGYAQWAREQPDGGSAELCGAMYCNGHLADLGCDMKTFFVCEHDISSAPRNATDGALGPLA